tara:strand:- start:325 stop:522 length:198 start_codon:yes stop_codon:yes gene_type:complete
LSVFLFGVSHPESFSGKKMRRYFFCKIHNPLIFSVFGVPQNISLDIGQGALLPDLWSLSIYLFVK